MLPRSQRLTTRAFSQAFSVGRTWRHPLLQVRVAPRNESNVAIVSTANEENAPRAAFVVAKKLGKATTRNRLRRQMREAYRLSSGRHNARLRNRDLIFMASPAAFDASPDALRDAVRQLLERASKASTDFQARQRPSHGISTASPSC